MRQKRKSYRGYDDDEDAIGDDLAAVNDRLDGLTRQLERMAQAGLAQAGMSGFTQPPAPPREAMHAPMPPQPAAPQPTDHVADALARLDRRLDQVINEGRAVAAAGGHHRYAPGAHAPQPYPAPPPAAHHAPQAAQPPAPKGGPAAWAAQISARQRALEGGAAKPAPHAPAPASHAPARPAPAMPQAAMPAPLPAPQPMPAPQPAFAPAYGHAQAAAPEGWGPGFDLSGLEHQLRQINTQISSLQQQQQHPYEDVLHTLRQDLADIGRALTEAMPRQAIETLETEIRSLSERVDRTRQAGADGAALAALERELAEIRAALQALRPAESLVGFEEAVHALSHKIDNIAAGAATPQDPLAFKQLEQAVVSLRGVVSNVASDGALAQLAAEVRGLASQFERAAADSSSEALGRLEKRIAGLMESGRAVPPELEGSIRQLSERLDRAQLSQGDQLALGALEDRIAKLSEKLDASDARLNHLGAIERGLADLLVHLEDMKNGGARTLRAAPPAEPAPAPAVPQRPAPVAPAQAPVHAPAPVHAAASVAAQSPLDLIPDMHPADAPAMAQPPAQLVPLAPRAPSAMPEPAQTEVMPPPRAARQMPRGPERAPIDPNLPADTPLEPGSGAPRVKPGSAAARIAASEAALSGFRNMSGDNGGKSSAIAAARHAAKSAYLDTPVKVPKGLNKAADKASSRWLKWPFKSKAKAAPEPQFAGPATAHEPLPPRMPGPMPGSIPQPAAPVQQAHAARPEPVIGEDTASETAPTRGQRVRKVLKTVVIAGSVAIIAVGAAQTAMDLLFPEFPPVPTFDAPLDADAPKAPPRSQPPATTPSRPMPAPQGAIPPPAADPEPTGQINSNASFFDPTTVIVPKLPLADVTGSIARKPAATKPAGPAHAPANHSGHDALPASIGPALRQAALASDPGAQYEMGARYAEGRGVPQNIAEAAQWFGRAADAGFAPAQFRLASLNEKGDGVKKDVQAARRLYLAAAGKGHAKAMHNLAVLYAEGIDGKPDYKTAAQWFRKAAEHGIADSQYNLAILYARGIGVTTNLAESYRWFALAAANGDADSAKKRDDVAARLDPKSLAAAKASAQSFVPEREPEDAIGLKMPPGGWDRTPAAPVKPKR